MLAHCAVTAENRMFVVAIHAIYYPTFWEAHSAVDSVSTLCMRDPN